MRRVSMNSSRHMVACAVIPSTHRRSPAGVLFSERICSPRSLRETHAHAHIREHMRGNIGSPAYPGSALTGTPRGPLDTKSFCRNLSHTKTLCRGGGMAMKLCTEYGGDDHLCWPLSRRAACADAESAGEDEKSFDAFTSVRAQSDSHANLHRYLNIHLNIHVHMHATHLNVHYMHTHVRTCGQT